MGVKWPPPVHFCFCMSKILRYTAKTPRAIYLLIKFCHISTGNVDMIAWNRKYVLGNEENVVCPIVNLTITRNKHFYRLLSYFHGLMAWICCWHGFLMSIFIAISDPENMCLVFGNFRFLFPVWNYNYFRFRARPWRHLTSSYLTWCCFSLHWVHVHLKSLTGY